MKTFTRTCLFKLLFSVVLISFSFKANGQTLIRDINSNYLITVPPSENISYQIVETNQFNYNGCSVDWKVTNSSNLPNGQTISQLGTNLNVTWLNTNGNAVIEGELKDCSVSSLNGKKATYSVPIRYLGTPGYITLNGSGYSNPKDVDCGVQTVTLTLSPVTNATTYSWDFSNTPGWSGSGNTATITATTSNGTGGTIYVTATRGDAPNVSAVSSIVINRPSLNNIAIIGVGQACIGQTHNGSLTNLPSGATVTWSVSGGVSIVSSSGGNATISYDSNGPATLTANITACGSSISRTRNLFVGPPNYFDIGGGEQMCSNQIYHYSVANNPNLYTDAATYSWTSGSSNLSIFGSGPFVDISSCCAGSYLVYVSATNSCGTIYQSIGIDVSTCFARYTISPNPASTYVTIEYDEVDKAEALPDYIELLSEGSGQPLKTVNVQEVFKNRAFKNGNQIQISTREYKRGTYYIRIINPRQVKDKQIETIRILIE